MPGGVLAARRQRAGCWVRSGVSGDTSDNDETAALAGIKAAGLVGETGG